MTPHLWSSETCIFASFWPEPWPVWLKSLDQLSSRHSTSLCGPSADVAQGPRAPASPSRCARGGGAGALGRLPGAAGSGPPEGPQPAPGGPGLHGERATSVSQGQPEGHQSQACGLHRAGPCRSTLYATTKECSIARSQHTYVDNVVTPKLRDPLSFLALRQVK